MNNEILLLMRWLEDGNSVDYSELKFNEVVANSARDRSLTLTTVVVSIASYAAVRGLVSHTMNQVEKFFEVSGEKKQAYIDAINGGNK